MTRAVFTRIDGCIAGFELTGHTGYAFEGGDILCAAITAAVRMCECLLNTVQNLSVRFTVDEASTSISCALPEGLSPADVELCHRVLSGLSVFLHELQTEYPGYIDIVES